ncbi:TIGR03943 family putative permease subunit [Nocardioides caldifontis]|uniref:TIGR03943 family putative permease subunit n=1 Tax=Nocardioides caldifontis TaxID=2588938 RepID=UPI0011DFE3C0|nr:TIGR03943 family protein [Nocardioides caldifontis]
MNRSSQAVVLLLVGALVVRQAITDEYLHFVNPWMRSPLLVSGGLLIALAALHAATDWRTLLSQAASDDERAQDHSERGHEVPRAAWLLVAPVLVFFLVAPAELGSYAAERRLSEVREPAQYVAMRPLPPGDPVRVTLVDFLVRSEHDPGRSLAGREIELVGFVTSKDDGSWFVTRFVMGCCAADATAYRVPVEGVAAPPDEAWVEVIGRWDEGRPARPTLKATLVRRTEPPRRPYE